MTTYYEHMANDFIKNPPDEDDIRALVRVLEQRDDLIEILRLCNNFFGTISDNELPEGLTLRIAEAIMNAEYPKEKT